MMRVSAAIFFTTCLLISQNVNAQDSDGDGLDDALENQLQTDVNKVDSDDDGLGDGFEVQNGTNPLERDSDGGGDWDVVELNNGFNPNDPNDDVNLLVGPGPYVQAIDDSSNITSFFAADVALVRVDYDQLFGFQLPQTVDFSEVEEGDFLGGEPMINIWGTARDHWVASVSGWLHIPESQSDNDRTIAVGCDGGCRLRVFDGSSTQEAEHEGDHDTVTVEVTFPNEGGLFPIEVVYYSDDGDESLELSWAIGHIPFSSATFTLIPYESILSPEFDVQQTVVDVNGGNVERGDLIEVTVSITNPSNVSIFSVSASDRNKQLLNRTFSNIPAEATTFSDVISFPIIDPGETKTYTYTGRTSQGTDYSIQSGVLGSVAPSDFGQAGRNRIRVWSDDPTVDDGVDFSNRPSGMFMNATGDDDANRFSIGQAIPFDECANDPNLCDINATCADTPASYTCTCNSGWTGDGVTCLNVDECTGGLDNCSANASCIDNDGGFDCACNPGYSGDGVACIDIDECADNTHDCAPNATCVNVPGSYSCMCDNGATTVDCVPENCGCVDGRTCIDGRCFTECIADLDCPDGLCFDGVCADDPCETVACDEPQVCAGGSCFDPCASEIDCSDPDHICFEDRCTLSECADINCGTEQVCFGGGCFNACTTSQDCQDGESCFDGRCARDACLRVTCGAAKVCFGGACFDTCFENSDCADDEQCYEGRCTEDPCLSVSCPDDQVCFGGGCFDRCTDDVDCSDPSELCYDFRCASDPCENVQCPTAQSCVQGFCRISCDVSNPCETGLDCEQGLCVPSQTPTGCCATAKTKTHLPLTLLLLGVIGVVLGRRKRRQTLRK